MCYLGKAVYVKFHKYLQISLQITFNCIFEKTKTLFVFKFILLLIIRLLVRIYRRIGTFRIRVVPSCEKMIRDPYQLNYAMVPTLQKKNHDMGLNPIRSISDGRLSSTFHSMNSKISFDLS